MGNEGEGDECESLEGASGGLGQGRPSREDGDEVTRDLGEGGVGILVDCTSRIGRRGEMESESRKAYWEMSEG
ncbi:unnamed protein product [Amaranthus hypochondriacus]